MKYFWFFLTLNAAFVSFYFLNPREAYASYINPGGDSYVVQIIIAVLLGGLFIVKLFLNKIKNFFKSLFFRKKM